MKYDRIRPPVRLWGRHKIEEAIRRAKKHVADALRRQKAGRKWEDSQ